MYHFTFLVLFVASSIGTGSANLTFDSSRNTKAPSGCRKLNSDFDWPRPDIWNKSLPNVIPRSASKAGAPLRPDYRFRARSAADVQRAVNFAAENNIRLTIITTGHDYLGRNDAPSGLSLDVSLLTGVRVLKSFTPTPQGEESVIGAKTNIITPDPDSQPAVTFGVGLATQTLNNAIRPSKLFTLGAGHGAVSVAGGWGQLAGHAPLSNQYGLGADQFLEFKVVTADGKLKVANKVSNPELFWALKGGGGGTFGVVTEATIKAYPWVPITVYAWWINSTSSLAASAFQSVASSIFGPLWGGGSNTADGINQAKIYLSTQLPSIGDKGTSAYIYKLPNAIRGVALSVDKNATTAYAKSVWEPVLKKMESIPGMKPFQYKIFHFPNYQEFFDLSYGKEGMCMPKRDLLSKSCAPNNSPSIRRRHGPEPGTTFGPLPVGMVPFESQLLTAKHLQDQNIASAIEKLSNGVGGMMLVSGNKVHRPDEDNSVNPAWRKAHVHLMGARMEPYTGLEAIKKLTQDSGSYANEGYWGEKNWKQSFWGTNYPKLSEIKTKHDPDMLFWATPGINADYMEVKDGRVCKTDQNKSMTMDTAAKAPKSDNTNSANFMENLERIIGSFESYGGFPAEAFKSMD